MTHKYPKLFVLLAGLASSGQIRADDTRISYTPMRPETVAILRSAILAATEGRENFRQENLAALRQLSQASWPRVTGLRFVHLRLKFPESVFVETYGWLLAEDQEEVRWLTVSDKIASLHKIHIQKIEDRDFKSALSTWLPAYLQKHKEGGEPGWDYISTLYPGLLSFRLAFWAAEYGLKDEAKALIVQLFKVPPTGLLMLTNQFAWRSLSDAMMRLRQGSHGHYETCVVDGENDRQQFLKTCRELRKTLPDSTYDAYLQSLIEPLDREAASTRPVFLAKKPGERTQAETIQFWIYQLRDLAAFQWSQPGSPEIFAEMNHPPTPADQLCAIGPAAIPFLIDALDDSTPTRTSVRNRFMLDSERLLRRQDIAFECLGRIVGCCFYRINSNLTLISDAPERQQSAIAHAKAWWIKSRGATQAQMIRNYLDTMSQNLTLQHDPDLGSFGSVRLHALYMLGILEGPETVIEQVRQIHQDRFFDEPTVRERLDPNSSLSQREIARFVASIDSADASLRRNAVASLKQPQSYQIQRSLLLALEREVEATERIKILQVLQAYPKLWHLPALIKVFKQDPDTQVRIEAGEIIRALVGDKSVSEWWLRLETRDAALDFARQLLHDGKAALEIRQVAFDILLAWDSFVDQALLDRLKSNCEFEMRCGG